MLMRVDPSAYASASQTFGEFFVNAIAEVQKSLNQNLADTSMSAGNDPAGIQFGEAYDLAAGQLVQSIEDLRRGALTIAGLLQQSGFNHTRSEALSMISGGTVPAEDTRTYDAGFDLCVVPPSIAGGGMGDPPEGWDVVAAAAGFIWPDGDTAKLKTIGTAWRTAADGLNATLSLISDGVSALADQLSPELDDARTICLSLGNIVAAIAEQAIVLAEAAESHAEEIDTAHSELIATLNEFLLATLAIEAAAAAAGVLTGGLGAVAMQIAEAAAIAKAADRITLIIVRVLQAVSITGGKMVWQSLDVVGDGLKAILARTPKIAEATPVSDALKAMDDLANKLSDSPWTLGPGPRGYKIEDRYLYPGYEKLPYGFPTFDQFLPDTGRVVSIKSLDLNPPFGQNLSSIRSTYRAYINKIATFTNGKRGGVEIDADDIKIRELLVVIPSRGQMSAGQRALLEELEQYAHDRGVVWRLEYER